MLCILKYSAILPHLGYLLDKTAICQLSDTVYLENATKLFKVIILILALCQTPFSGS